MTQSFQDILRELGSPMPPATTALPINLVRHMSPFICLLVGRNNVYGQHVGCNTVNRDKAVVDEEHDQRPHAVRETSHRKDPQQREPREYLRTDYPGTTPFFGAHRHRVDETRPNLVERLLQQDPSAVRQPSS